MNGFDPPYGEDYWAMTYTAEDGCVEIKISKQANMYIIDDIQPRSFRMPVYENTDTLRMYARLRKEEGLSSSEAKKTIELVTGDKPNDHSVNNSMNVWGAPPDNNGLPFYHHRRRF